ncbi:DNA adenine methylase [Erysipelothrix rhusiopathiae]|nr:DNA adenine methylase [Erysipelothrix rhusiopathiae]MDE8088032.1 DNA adenine methylase [Erysipelothrix rhusiopathiae]MDE8155116.1 DNA adenine methylase [Erysipelothrix rhusiopathiae]MDE8189306.1 DNA adenine methylase [Erysipelothrix rhusiopathiae]MDE8291362.1 DNA adenine methylase [Erysipelothrix rhusiopathiae]
MYRYIGNKTKLTGHILKAVREIIGEEGTVADVMAGTGLVSFALRKEGYHVIASDIMTYSYHHLLVNLTLDHEPEFKKLIDSDIFEDTGSKGYKSVLEFLNSLKPIEDFFFQEFSPGGVPKNGLPSRKYFTEDNAKRIDAIRAKINEWIDSNLISESEESLLKHTLIMAVNEVANISGTYGYFLSSFKKNALSDLVLKPIDFYPENSEGHVVKIGFAEDLAETISADLCYIDPPYIKRQYAANYHILETIARGDYPDAIGKSGLRDWWDQHSKFCTKTKGLDSFERIFQNMDCNNFLISYSEDGLFSLEQLTEVFEKYGEVDIQEIDYNRFKSNNSRLNKQLKEYLISIRRKV